MNVSQDSEMPDVKAKQRTVERIRQQGMPSVYTNSIEIKVSVLDVLLVLLDVQEATEELLRVEELIRVHMSPQLAKILSGLLVEKLADYEREFGPIPMPKGSASSAT